MDRLVIKQARNVIVPGTKFWIDIAGDVTVAILQCGSVTHSFNFDQRYVGLSFLVSPPSGLGVV
jgi:hypothetical protein